VAPLTLRQKALLASSPCIAALLGSLAWALVDQIRGWKDFRV